MDSKEKQLLTTTVGVKGNVRAITIADFDFDHFDALLDVIERHYDFWAYIVHDKDFEIPSHFHILAIMRGGTTLKTQCEYFEGIIDSNFICKVKNPRSMAKYLIHKGYHDKHQYAIDEVFTNDKGRFVSMLDEYTDSGNAFKDYRKVLSGLMTFDDFISRYQAEFSTMPFYQKLSIYHRILCNGAIQTGDSSYRPPRSLSAEQLNVAFKNSHCA